MPKDLVNSLDLPKWGLGLATAVAGWFVGRLTERSNTRTKEAIEACGRLRTLLSEWLDGIQDAVRSEASRDATLQKLEKFMLAHKFEFRLKAEEASLQQEPACSYLLALAELFHAEALVQKGKLWELLEDHESYDSSYELYKVEALKRLDGAYQEVLSELDLVVAFLERKRNRIIPWLGRRRPRRG